MSNTSLSDKELIQQVYEIFHRQPALESIQENTNYTPLDKCKIAFKLYLTDEIDEEALLAYLMIEKEIFKVASEKDLQKFKERVGYACKN